MVAGTLRHVMLSRSGQYFKVPDHVLSRSVGDDTVLLDLHQDEYFSLGQVGSQIWVLLSEGRALGAVVERISDQYGAERDRVEADVATFVDDLVSSNLLVEG